MIKKIIILTGSFLLILVIFQNCSEGTTFSSAEDKVSAVTLDSIQDSSQDTFSSEVPANDTPIGVTVCNPLNPTETCPVNQNPNNPDVASNISALKGKLYYLTPEIHNSIFNNNLNNALIDDYRNHGIVVPVDILMTSVNITPRSWSDGFTLPSGGQVTKENNEKLFEWFHLDLKGFISLPEGSYELSTLSDDGMRITLNNEVIINDDGTHSPRYKCALNIINFARNEKKYIRVQYFQGPRTQIAMQLLMRPASKSNLGCNSSGQWETINSNAYSQN